MVELKVDPDKIPKAEEIRSRLFLSTLALAVSDQDIRLTQRRAFPNVPWAFLYRDPVEVLVSQMHQRGMQMVPEIVPASLYGLNGFDGGSIDGYSAQVLAKICEAAAGGTYSTPSSSARSCAARSAAVKMPSSARRSYVRKSRASRRKM